MAARRGRRTDYQWTNFGDREQSHDVTATGGTLGSTGSVVVQPSTLMRVRGMIGIQLDPSAVDESVMLLCALVKMSADVFVAGVAPEIFTNSDDEASWIW